MGSTKCYDALIALAKVKVKTLKSNTEPPEIDQNMVDEADAERDKYESIADGIYNASVAAIDAKYKAMEAAVKASKPILKAQYTQERFNSTDVDKYSEEGIKTTLQREFNRLMSTDEEYLEKLQEEREKAEENDATESENNQVQQGDKEASESKDRRKERKEKRIAKNKAEKEIRYDVISAASEIGKGEDKCIDDYEEKRKESYNAFKLNIEEYCKDYGENKGAKLVQKFNTEIRKAAKKKFEANKDNLAKAQVLLEQGKQTAALKICGMLGL